MYYRIKIGQYPNINVGADIVLDSSPRPNAVFNDARRIAEMLRGKYDKVTVFNLSKIEKGNGFLHFRSGYIIEVKVGDEVSFYRWFGCKKAVRDVALSDKALIDDMGIDSKVELISINRKPINNGISINHSV